MSTQTRLHRPVVSDLPDDFGERIENFRLASGLSVRSLARLLGVSPYRLREWRRGVAPHSRHLYLLLMIAERMALRELLVRLGDDLPAEVERQLPAARGGDGRGPGRSGPPPSGLCATGHSPHSLREPVRSRYRAATAGAHRTDPRPRQPVRLAPEHNPHPDGEDGIAMPSTI